MGRPLRTITPELRTLWVDTLRAYEAGELTREWLMGYHEIGERTLRSRLAEARAWRDEDEGDFCAEIDDGFVLHLTDDPANELADWYDLGNDKTSRDGVGGSVLVSNHNGTRLRRQRLGTGTRNAEARNDKYKPDDRLKGGVG